MFGRMQQQWHATHVASGRASRHRGGLGRLLVIAAVAAVVARALSGRGERRRTHGASHA
ncbi:MAG: hypothetical protein AB7L91_04185 [Dehalococcoidia bacterium]